MPYVFSPLPATPPLCQGQPLDLSSKRPSVTAPDDRRAESTHHAESTHRGLTPSQFDQVSSSVSLSYRLHSKQRTTPYPMGHSATSLRGQSPLTHPLTNQTQRRDWVGENRNRKEVVDFARDMANFDTLRINRISTFLEKTASWPKPMTFEEVAKCSATRSLRHGLFMARQLPSQSGPREGQNLKDYVAIVDFARDMADFDERRLHRTFIFWEKTVSWPISMSVYELGRIAGISYEKLHYFLRAGGRFSKQGMKWLKQHGQGNGEAPKSTVSSSSWLSGVPAAPTATRHPTVHPGSHSGCLPSLAPPPMSPEQFDYWKARMALEKSDFTRMAKQTDSRNRRYLTLDFWKKTAQWPEPFRMQITELVRISELPFGVIKHQVKSHGTLSDRAKQFMESYENQMALCRQLDEPAPAKVI